MWVRARVRSKFGFQNGREALLSRTSGVIHVTVTSQDRIRAQPVRRAGLSWPF